MKQRPLSDFRVSELLSRKVLGSITAAETAELDEWIELSAENKQFCEQFMRQAALGKRIGRNQNFDIDLHWADFLKKIGQSEIPVKKFSRFFKYAAAVSVPVIFGFAFYFVRLNQEVKPVSIALIPKATAGVVVYTSGGKTINLESVHKIENGVIVDADNTRELVYDNDTSVKDQFHTIVVPAGRDFKIVLADGSSVWLNAGTTLTYPLVFRGAQREVQLNGEAFFEIKHRADQPFLIKANGVNIQDLGTCFNVKSYKSESKTTTTVVSGLARMADPSDPSVAALLQPGFQSSYTAGSSNMETRAVDVNSFIAWKDGMFDFGNQTLEDIMSDLSRWYGVDVEIGRPELRKMRFKGTINKSDSFERIATVLENTGKVRVSVSQNKIYVK